MAHSSGGGSHGGGCHSSSHSGSRGHSGSHTRSHSRFPGSRRYRYYDRHGNEKYVYSNYDITQKQRIHWGLILFYIPFFAVFFLALKDSYFKPEKIFNLTSQIMIEDNLHVIHNENQLRRDLERFYEETGVTPAVKTICDNERHGQSLMDYALDEYYRYFDDEMHWLIVYSAPKEYEGNRGEDIQYSNWSFEGIIGDDAGPSISDDLCDQFTEQVYDNLCAMTDPGAAVGDAFTELMDLRQTSGAHLDLGTIAICGVMFAFLVFHMLIMTGLIGGNRKYRNAVLDDGPMVSSQYTDRENGDF